MTVHTYGEPPDKPVKRKCRWCGHGFKVPRDYPKRTGCPDCQPQLFDGQVIGVEEHEELARDLPD